MKKVIITGANGFVGSYLTRCFAECGFEVTAIVRNETSDISSIRDIERVKIVYCDLDNIEMLPSILSGKYELFMHFAWNSSAGSGRSDVNIQLNNVHATCMAVKIAKMLGCRRFVFAGSIMEYEAKEYVLETSGAPNSAYIYSIAKLTASMMAKTLSASQNIEYIDTVISNIYGVGEKSMRFLNSTVKKILSSEKVRLTSCQQMYDFIYITDAVEAIKIAALKGESMTSYYIGNKNQRILKDFVLDIKDVLKSDTIIEFGVIPFNGTYFNYNDVIDTHAVHRLGFNADINFKTGVKILADSMRAAIENNMEGN